MWAGPRGLRKDPRQRRTMQVAASESSRFKLLLSAARLHRVHHRNKLVPHHGIQPLCLTDASILVPAARVVSECYRIALGVGRYPRTTATIVLFVTFPAASRRCVTHIDSLMCGVPPEWLVRSSTSSCPSGSLVD